MRYVLGTYYNEMSVCAYGRFTRIGPQRRFNSLRKICKIKYDDGVKYTVRLAKEREALSGSIMRCD